MDGYGSGAKVMKSSKWSTVSAASFLVTVRTESQKAEAAAQSKTKIKPTKTQLKK